MKSVNIQDLGHPIFETFKALYTSSFPIFEQRTIKQQEEAFSDTNYHLTGYEENGNFIGFISYWEFDNYIYRTFRN